MFFFCFLWYVSVSSTHNASLLEQILNTVSNENVCMFVCLNYIVGGHNPFTQSQHGIKKPHRDKKLSNTFPGKTFSVDYGKGCGWSCGGNSSG